MKYAVIKHGGTQYLVSEGDQLVVNRLAEKEGEKIKINEVLLLVNEDKVTLGKPLVKEASVNAKIMKHFKGEKVRVAKFKAKTGYRRVTGFRSQLTLIEVEKITA